MDKLWSNDGTAPEYFITTMSKRRFQTLGSEERKKVDNLASIWRIWEKFLQACSNSYSPGENITTDEMMEPFRGRCKFRVYMKSKPWRYGIKIYATVDSRTFYTLYMEIYK